MKKYMNYIWSLIIIICICLALCAIFALILFGTNIDKSLIPAFSTICLSISAFCGSFFLSKKIKKKGYIIGIVCGGIIYLITFIVSVFLSGDFTYNTIFRLIIIIISSVIGGVMGVNKLSKKII